ncbi:MAG: Smr/MutS family protein [Pseudomonadota bacterium]
MTVTDRGEERKVRRGQVPFAARIDLHGHSQSSADAILKRFISHQRQADARCVLVITGKGRDGQSVLKRNFLLWLNSPGGRSAVSGFAEAHPRHGGGGAFYVWLRRG